MILEICDNYIQNRDRTFSMYLTPEQQAADPNTSPEQLRVLVNQAIETLILIAQHPNATSETLQQLADVSYSEPWSNSYKAVHEAVASNPNTPIDVLFYLGMRFPKQLLNNPVFSLLILENPNFLEQMPSATQYSLHAYCETPENLRNRLQEIIDKDIYF